MPISTILGLESGMDIWACAYSGFLQHISVSEVLIMCNVCLPHMYMTLVLEILNVMRLAWHQEFMF